MQAPDPTQMQIDILHNQLDQVEKEKSRLVVDVEMFKARYQEQGRELARLHAEVGSRRNEIIEAVRRAAQAMEELNQIIKGLHERLDRQCDSWEIDVRELARGEDLERRLGVIASFRTPQIATIAEG